MDVLFLIAAGIVVTIFTFIGARVAKLAYDERQFKRRRELFLQQTEDTNRRGAAATPQRRTGPVVIGGRRRNVGNRPRRQNENADDVLDFMEGGGANEWGPDPEQASDAEDPNGEEGEDGEPRHAKADFALPEGKVGKKKLAKLEAKAEKRAAREAEFAEREERKQRDAEREAKQREEDEREKKEEQERAEQERLEREERERREQEEYERMKAQFAVEEEGFDEENQLTQGNLLKEFVQFVQDSKVVNMDDLAAKFKLRSIDVANRIKDLMEQGTLSGVLDDRGKFIHITQAELEGVARFINQRGRVSIQELVEYSNQLINLEPVLVNS